MFCHKCGTQITDGAVFCHGCGTKVVYEEAAQPQNAPAPIVEPQKSSMAESVRQLPATPAQKSSPTGNEYGFKEFVDSRVRATTNYQSAEELLNSRVPKRFVWVCFGVPAIWTSFILTESFTLGNAIMVLVSTLILGYIAVVIVDSIRVSRIILQTSRNSIKFNGKLDIDDLIDFLNSYLACWEPWFHKWGYFTYEGIGIRGVIVASSMNVATAASKIITLTTEFGDKGWYFAKINVKNDEAAIDAGYSFGVTLRGFAFWAIRSACIIKFSPILQATMEYYLTYYRKN